MKQEVKDFSRECVFPAGHEIAPVSSSVCGSSLALPLDL